jgi:hypothetical protein
MGKSQQTCFGQLTFGYRLRENPIFCHDWPRDAEIKRVVERYMAYPSKMAWGQSWGVLEPFFYLIQQAFYTNQRIFGLPIPLLTAHTQAYWTAKMTGFRC